MEFPGFTTLKLIAEGDTLTSPEYFVETTNGMYFSNISFIRKLIESTVNYKHSAHGPCLSDICFSAIENDILHSNSLFSISLGPMGTSIQPYLTILYINISGGH
jgi:hypothetical protein